MSARPNVASFVEQFFTNMLFQEDELVCSNAVMEDVAADATILINGDMFDRKRLAEGNVLPYRLHFTGKLTEFKDLNVRSLDNITGLAAQHADFVLTPKEGTDKGEHIHYHATTLVQVGLKADGSGAQCVTGMWIVMGPDVQCGVEAHNAPAEAKAAVAA